MKIVSNGKMIELPPRGPAGPDGSPIGTIISYMGLSAPKDYLVCDGTVYSISDYPDLAAFFRKEFGTVNHFGGDGTATFAVPDMRNLFIRGYHGESEEQLSGDIGQKQASSRIPRIWGGKSALGVYMKQGEEYFGIRDYDSSVKDSSGYTRYSTTFYSEEGMDSYFTIRPVNMAVLYCIKAVESVSGSQAQDIYSLEEQVVGRWIDGRPVYKRSAVLTSPQSQVMEGVLNLDDYNVDILVSLKGMLISPDGAQVPLNTYNAQGSWCVLAMAGIYSQFPGHKSIGMLVKNAAAYLGVPVYVTIKYVKTTDQPTIELPAALIAALSQTAYKATPQSVASAELTAGIKTEEV